MRIGRGLGADLAHRRELGLAPHAIVVPHEDGARILDDRGSQPARSSTAAACSRTKLYAHGDLIVVGRVVLRYIMC